MAFRETATGTIPASGKLTLKLSTVPMGDTRNYIRVALELSTGEQSVGGNAKIYAGDELPNRYVDGTSTPWQDTASFSPGQAQVDAPEQMTIVFNDCDVGAEARVTAQYENV